MADEPDFVKQVSSSPYDTSATGLGTSPAYLSQATASASSASSSVGGGTVDVYANRPTPAAGKNQFFYSTDQVVTYVSDGSSWYRVSDPAGTCSWWYSASAPTGWVLYDGSNIGGSTGIYADLYTHLGGLATPDTRGRMLVSKGTHTDVSTIGNNEGSSVANRRPKHPHSDTISFSDTGHTHNENGTDVVLVTSGGGTGHFTTLGANDVAPSGSTTASGNANLSKSGTVGAAGTANDAPSYITFCLIAKL